MPIKLCDVRSVIDLLNDYMKSSQDRITKLESLAEVVRVEEASMSDTGELSDTPIEYLLCAENVQDLYYNRGVCAALSELRRIIINRIGGRYD